MDDFGNESEANQNFVFNIPLTIGQGAASQGAFTGVFQNRFMPSVNAIWTVGRHTITFGGTYSYTQLKHAQICARITAISGLQTFRNSWRGAPTPYTADGFVTTAFLQGDANRYLRSGSTGFYVQDKYQFRSNLSVTLGCGTTGMAGSRRRRGASTISIRRSMPSMRIRGR